MTDIDVQGASFLVTGGCGFIGSNVVRRLLDANVGRCVVLDNLFTGERSFLPKNDAIEFVEGSVTDAELVESVMKRVDYVIHCAAVNIIAAQREPMLDLEVNARGTLLLLQTAVRLGHIRKFVYTSSASIYGNPVYLPIVEQTRASPMSNYAVSKLTGESYTNVYYLLYDLPAVVVRYSNVYGPFQSPRNVYSGVVTKVIALALRDQPVEIHGSGLQTRDFTFVDDAVEATLLAALSPKAEGATFNIATGYEVRILELAEKVFQLLGKEPDLKFIQKRDIDNISRRCLNIENVRTRLKWEPRFGIDAGLARTLDWFKSHQHLLPPT